MPHMEGGLFGPFGALLGGFWPFWALFRPHLEGGWVAFLAKIAHTPSYQVFFRVIFL